MSRIKNIIFVCNFFLNIRSFEKNENFDTYVKLSFNFFYILESFFLTFLDITNFKNKIFST